jgi:hypothetical protein
VAVQCGPKSDDTFVRGIGEYSSGRHNVRFLFKKSNIESGTWFSVVSKKIPISAYCNDRFGWTSNDTAFPSNTKLPMEKSLQDMMGQTTFEIELHVDCDNRKISYVNRRTKNQRELKVDIKKCPFPWQLEFYLYEPGDCVRFLP